MNVWLPVRSTPLAAILLAASLAGCAMSSSGSASGSGVAQTEADQRAGAQPPTPVVAANERALACLHCAP